MYIHQYTEESNSENISSLWEYTVIGLLSVLDRTSVQCEVLRPSYLFRKNSKPTVEQVISHIGETTNVGPNAIPQIEFPRSIIYFILVVHKYMKSLMVFLRHQMSYCTYYLNRKKVFEQLPIWKSWPVWKRKQILISSEEHLFTKLFSFDNT